MTKFISILLLLVSTLGWAETTLYKYTDENGVTHYSQTKIDDRYEAVKTQPVSIVPSIVKTTPTPKSQSSNEEPVTFESLLKTFKITSPKPEENLWGTGLSVTASVQVDPALLETHDIQFVLDGKAKPANRKATQKFEQVHRGEHKIYGQLVMKGSNRVVKKSKEVTFYIHQHSKK